MVSYVLVRVLSGFDWFCPYGLYLGLSRFFGRGEVLQSIMRVEGFRVWGFTWF